MHHLSIRKRSELFFISLLFIIFIIISLILTSNIFINQKTRNVQKYSINTSSDCESDILAFWQREMGRVNATDLNIKFGDDIKLPYKNPYTGKEYTFQGKEIWFDSPNWVGASPSIITLHGYLLFPKNLESSNPGCLCMHGLNGNANQSFNLAYQYLEKGFVVLTYDHPGHGKSEGSQPRPSNFYGGDVFNESSHNYLTICGAIQGLRVLENLSYVDNSKIFVTGSSYGALNTMWLASIAGERIAGAVPYIAIGDLKKVLKYPDKLLFWVWNKTPQEIPDSFWEKQAHWFDPIYYLSSPKLPPILWQIGTNDEFFPYESINATYLTAKNNNAFIQIYPNGHHGFPGYENTTKFFIDYVLKNGSRPPSIIPKIYNKKMGFMGTTLKVEVSINSEEKIKSVKVVYRYLDIIGSIWESKELNKNDKDVWTGEIGPGILNSRVAYYFIAVLDGSRNIWFSSIIYTPGMFLSFYTILFYAILFSFIALPVIFIIMRRYRFKVLQIPEKKQKDAKKFFKIEMTLLTITNIIFFLSLILPWVVFESGPVIWTHIYVFNNLYTWTLIFGALSGYLTILFFIGWILTSQLSYHRPMLAGLLKIWYPIFIFIIFGIYYNITFSSDPNSPAFNFGLVYPGAGLYIMLFSSIAFFVIGIWKRKYQTKLRLRIPKTKWYNIDRWFRIRIEELDSLNRKKSKKDKVPERNIDEE